MDWVDDASADILRHVEGERGFIGDVIRWIADPADFHSMQESVSDGEVRHQFELSTTDNVAHFRPQG